MQCFSQKKNTKKKVYFILEKRHSQDCLNRLITDVKYNNEIIGNYKKFYSECNDYLNKLEQYITNMKF